MDIWTGIKGNAKKFQFFFIMSVSLNDKTVKFSCRMTLSFDTSMNKIQ